MTAISTTLTAQLCDTYGCGACKKRVDDEYLLHHERFFCMKQRKTFAHNDAPHKDCEHWTFNGDPALVKSVQPNDNQPLPFTDEEGDND